MTGFEPQASGIGSDRSTNWATTTTPFLRSWHGTYNSRAIESEVEAAARLTRRIDDFLDLQSLSQDHAELYQVTIPDAWLSISCLQLAE